LLWCCCIPAAQTCELLDVAGNHVGNQSFLREKHWVRDVFMRHLLPYVNDISDDAITDERTIPVR
jgi:hypothetical protein